MALLEADAGEEGEGDIVSDLKLNRFTHKTRDKNILLYTGWPGGRFHRPNQDVGRYFGPFGDIFLNENAKKAQILGFD